MGPLCYLPLVVAYGGVDVLLQQLLRLQLVDPQSPEQLSDLLALQRLQAAQQGGMDHTHILVQGGQWTCGGTTVHFLSCTGSGLICSSGISIFCISSQLNFNGQSMSDLDIMMVLSIGTAQLYSVIWSWYQVLLWFLLSPGSK